MSYPQFIDDTTYISMDASATDTEQLQAMLSNLTRIHLLTASKFESFDELIHEYLVSGIEVFGLETGIVSEIKDETYIVRDVISPLEVLEKGQEFALEDTYCREVIKSRQVLGFPKVGELEYMNCHPVYQNLKLEAYLSSPIFVGDELFGTLNFTSVAAREHGFSVHERNLVVLMANAIGAFILLRRKEDRLLELNLKMKSFVGYVAHDLRNPLGTIMGLAKMATKSNAKPERLPGILTKIQNSATGALELVNSILEVAALGTGKLTLTRDCILLSSLVEGTLSAVEYFAEESQADINVNFAPDIMLECDARHVQQSLVNLLINAVKYSPCGAQITFSVQPADHARVDVCISNPKMTSAELVQAVDKKVYGSVGFGLEIVHEVLAAHDSELRVTETDSHYEARFSLPTCQ